MRKYPPPEYTISRLHIVDGAIGNSLIDTPSISILQGNLLLYSGKPPKLRLVGKIEQSYKNLLFPYLNCYYSLSGRLFQVPRTGFFYSSIPPQVWPRSCSFSGCCTSGTGSSSRAFSTRGRNCSGKCRSRKSSTAPIPSWSRAEIPRSQLKSSSRYSTCTLSCRFSFSSRCRSWASFSFSFIEGIFC